MFGPSITTVFASRWKALMWSAGILLTAYCSVPSQDETDAGAALTPAVHTNPWAKNPSEPSHAPTPTPNLTEDQGLREVEALTRKLAEQ